MYLSKIYQKQFNHCRLKVPRYLIHNKLENKGIKALDMKIVLHYHYPLTTLPYRIYPWNPSKRSAAA